MIDRYCCLNSCDVSWKLKMMMSESYLLSSVYVQRSESVFQLHVL